MEEDHQSEDPTESGDDMGSLGGNGDGGAFVPLLEHHEPTATPVGVARDAGTRGDVPEMRKRTTKEVAAREQEVKQARSPRPLEVPSASQPPMPTGMGRGGRSGMIVNPSP